MTAIQRELTAASSPRSDRWLSLAFSGRSVRKVKPRRSETPRPPKVAADWAYEGKPTARVMSCNAGLRRCAAGDHTPRLASGGLFFLMPEEWSTCQFFFFFFSFQPPPADEHAVLRVLSRVHQEVMCERGGLFLPSFRGWSSAPLQTRCCLGPDVFSPLARASLLTWPCVPVELDAEAVLDGDRPASSFR